MHPRKNRERLPLSLFLNRAPNYSSVPPSYCTKVHSEDARPSMSKNSSLDFSVKSGNIGKDVLEFYAKKKTSKYAVTDVIDSPDGVSHSRTHSQIYSPPYTLTPFMPITMHRGQQLVDSRYPSSNIPSSQSGESISLTDPRIYCFEPSYNTLAQVSITANGLIWRTSVLM